MRAVDETSPWWECPECGGIEFRAVVVFEKGMWVDESNYEFEYPPTGFVNTVITDLLECVREGCHHRFNPAEVFGWTKKAEVPN